MSRDHFSALERAGFGSNVHEVAADGSCRVLRIDDETGEGFMTMYRVFGGVYLMYNDFHLRRCVSEYQNPETVLCIDHCREGRIEHENSLGDVISQPSGALKSTIVERIDSIETTLAYILPEFTTGIGAPIIILVYVFVISWKLGLAALVTVPLGIVCYALMMFGYEENYGRTVRATKALNAVTTEYINGIEVIKVFGKAQSSYEKFAAADWDMSVFTCNYSGYSRYVLRCTLED